jgi:aryl sulfotransferase
VAEPTPVRYRSPDEDSARWLAFPVRDGDIVISTRSKSGTTWIQMICALLVFGTDDLPAPLGEISPWLDWLGTPRDEVWRQLAAQRHRRIVKTHTPLDGLPLDPRATYLVGARHPLDMAVSLYHQGDNLDRERMRELTGHAAPAAPAATAPRPPARDWLLAWIEGDADPRTQLDSLPGVLWHLRDAWERRDEPNIELVHYEDLSADLDGEMRRIARQLRIDVPDTDWPGLVDAARFDRMRDRADDLAPDRAGVLKSRARFFRRGGSGEGRALLSPDELDRYHARTRELAPPDLLQWLHRGER